MIAEQRRILEMLEEGKISAPEADILLQALGKDVEKEGNGRVDGEVGVGAAAEIQVENGNENSLQTFADLNQDQLMEMSIHGVNADYVRKMRGLGLGELSPEQLVEMKIHGVSAKFVEAMRELGYRDLKLGEVIEMSIHGVSADYVRKMKEQGFSDLTVGKLVEMQIHGLSPELVSEMRSLA